MLNEKDKLTREKVDLEVHAIQNAALHVSAHAFAHFPHIVIDYCMTLQNYNEVSLKVTGF